MEALIQREEDDREELRPPSSKSQSRSAASSPSAAGQRACDDVTAIPSLEKAPAESSLSPAEAEEEGGGFLPEVQAVELEPSEDAAGVQSTSGRKRQRTQEEEQEEEAAFDAAAVADMEAAVHQYEQSKLTAPAPADKDVLTCNECQPDTGAEHTESLLASAAASPVPRADRRRLCPSSLLPVQVATWLTTCRSSGPSQSPSATAAPPSTARRTGSSPRARPPPRTCCPTPTCSRCPSC